MPLLRRRAAAPLAGLAAWALASSSAAAGLEPAGWLKLDKRLLLEDRAALLPIYHEASLGLAAFPAEQLELHMSGRLRFYDVAITGGLDGLGDPAQAMPMDLLLWEASVDVYDVIRDRLDLRLGKQRVAWGTADRFNPTDNLNPDDLSDFLAFGAKLPTWALRADLIILEGYLKLTAVWLPGPVPALLPRFGELPLGGSTADSVGELAPSDIATAVGTVGLGLPRADLAHSMQALKLAGSALGVDWSLSYFHGYDDIPIEKDVVIRVVSPVEIAIDATAVLPETHVAGADLAGELFSVGWWVEAAVFFPQEVALALTAPTLQGRRTAEAVILHADPYTKLTAGLDYTFFWGSYVNLQYVHGLFAERGGALRDYLVLGLRHNFLDGQLTLTNGFIFDTDAFDDVTRNYGVSMTYELLYKPFDNIDLGLGHVLIAGEGRSLFAGMPHGDQTYLKAKVSF
ncbi:MAG: hypothetical protein JXR83_18925 [Deltaproteobacteria bacterium]|nr:hypothetical protein [Deltaproteobacteria bacterium]